MFFNLRLLADCSLNSSLISYIMSKKVQTAHNFVSYGYKPKGKSMTVPGQVHSIGTILERFQRGQGVQSFPGVYNSDLPGYENMSKIERIEAAKEQAAVVAKMRNDLARKKASEKAKAFEAAVIERHKKASAATGSNDTGQ